MVRVHTVNRFYPFKSVCVAGKRSALLFTPVKFQKFYVFLEMLII